MVKTGSYEFLTKRSNQIFIGAQESFRSDRELSAV